MRHYSWRRLLLLRSNTRSSLNVSSSISSHLHRRRQVNSSWSPYLSDSSLKRPSINSSMNVIRHFSSEPLAKYSDPDLLVVLNVFTNFMEVDVSREMETNGVVVSHDLVLQVLASFNWNPDAALQFFSWISDKDAQKLSYESYIMMLSVLALNGYREECSDLVDTMIEKGYLPPKVPREKERLIKSDDEKLGVRIGVIVRDNDVWSVDVEKQIRELINVSFSAELVMAAIDILSMDPMKALMFFRWVDESGLYNHCQRSYNAVALVLGTKDCNLDTFWKVADEMKSKGYEMEDKMLIKLLRRLMKRNMNKEAVDLYEFAMAGKDYPSFSCLVLLMNELESAKQLDTGLHSRIMNSFFGNANALPFSVVKILREAASGKPRVGFRVELKNANEFVDFVKARGMSLDTEPFMPLAYGIGRSRSGTDPLETASIFFKMLINNQGISGADYALEQLVEAYCGKCRVTKMFGDKNRAADACKLLHECINLYSLKPLDTTYKLLISNLLLAKDGFKDALSVLDLMTSHGYPPFLDPFISYLSEQGTENDGVDFLALVVRVFEGYISAGRRGAAQDLLEKCPVYIRNHVDVLNLFTPVKTLKSYC